MANPNWDASRALFPDNNTEEITPKDVRDSITNTETAVEGPIQNFSSLADAYLAIIYQGTYFTVTSLTEEGIYRANIDNPSSPTDFTIISGLSSVLGEKVTTLETSVNNNTNNISTNAGDITTIETKTDFITVTQAVNLDTMESDIALNTAKETNVTTDLTAAYLTTSVQIQSSDGIDATIVAAVADGDAGVMTGTDKKELDDATLGIANIIDGTTPQVKTVYTNLTGSEPAWQEGQAYYANGTFNIQTNYVDTTLQLGQEIWKEVINNTGTLIPNGSVVTHVGVVSSLPSIELALADDFTNALVYGMTTMDIPDGQTGIITKYGTVSSINTSGLTPGAIAYLSDITPGALTNTAPPIASIVGYVAISDVTVGVFDVAPRSLVSLPTVYSSMEGGSSGDITNVYQDIKNYSAEDNLLIPTSLVNGTMTLPSAGKYRMTSNIAISYNNIGNSKPTLTLGIYDGTAIVAEIPVVVTKDSEGYALFPSKLFTAVAGKSYNLQIKCSDNLANVVYDLMTFEVESSHIR